jgi:hypothetical protein
MIIYDETDALKLNKMSESHSQKYLDLLLTSENSIKSFSSNYFLMFKFLFFLKLSYF